MSVKAKTRLENLLAKIAGNKDAKAINPKTKGESLLDDIAGNSGGIEPYYVDFYKPGGEIASNTWHGNRNFQEILAAYNEGKQIWFRFSNNVAVLAVHKDADGNNGEMFTAKVAMASESGVVDVEVYSTYIIEDIHPGITYAVEKNCNNGMFLIHRLLANPVYKLDKTWEEILNAAKSGTVVALINQDIDSSEDRLVFSHLTYVDHFVSGSFEHPYRVGFGYCEEFVEYGCDTRDSNPQLIS